MKFITLSLKNRWRWVAFTGYAVIFAFILFWCLSFTPAYETAAPGDIHTEDLEAAELGGTEYKNGKGLITISCEYSGKGGVYVFLNGRMKLYLSKEPKNLKVSVGDIVFVRGAELESSAKVTVTGAEGKIDLSIEGESVTVENLTKRLVKIRACQ